MSRVSIQDLTKAARALEYHGEDDHAENVTEYVAIRAHRVRRLYVVTKSFLGYAILAVAAVVTVGGAVHLALRGQYFGSLGLLFVGVVVFGFFRLMANFADAVIEWSEDNIGALEVQDP